MVKRRTSRRLATRTSRPVKANAGKRTRAQVLKVTGPLNAKIDRLREQKRDRMYELMKAERFDDWDREKLEFEAKIEAIEDQLGPLDHEYWAAKKNPGNTDEYRGFRIERVDSLVLDELEPGAKVAPRRSPRDSYTVVRVTPGVGIELQHTAARGSSIPGWGRMFVYEDQLGDWVTFDPESIASLDELLKRNAGWRPDREGLSSDAREMESTAQWIHREGHPLTAEEWLGGAEIQDPVDVRYQDE